MAILFTWIYDQQRIPYCDMAYFMQIELSGDVLLRSTHIPSVLSWHELSLQLCLQHTQQLP